MTDEPVPLDAALRWVTDDLVAGQRRADTAGGSTDLARQWEALVGPKLAGCTLPGSFREGVLTVHALDPTAASLVRQSAGSLRKQLGAVLANLTQIRVVVTRPR